MGMGDGFGPEKVKEQNFLDSPYKSALAAWPGWLIVFHEPEFIVNEIRKAFPAESLLFIMQESTTPAGVECSVTVG